MEANTKAKYLLNLFNPIALKSDNDKSRAGEYNAKQSALLLAEEMLNELSDLPRIPYNERREKYWQEVTKEIHKI